MFTIVYILLQLQGPSRYGFLTILGNKNRVRVYIFYISHFVRSLYRQKSCQAVAWRRE